MPVRIGLEYKLDRDTREALQRGMIQMTVPVLEQQDIDWTPHQHPTENQQTLFEAFREHSPLDVAQQAAQPDIAGEHDQGNRECEACNPQAAPKVPLALRVRPPKVFVNGIGRLDRVDTERLGKVNEQAHGLCRPIRRGRGDDIGLGVAFQGSFLQWRGIQGVEQLRQSTDAEPDRGDRVTSDINVTHRRSSRG